MLNFNSIPGHARIKIAEKMNFFNQMMFCFSSKQGMDIVNLSKVMAILEFEEIEIKKEEILFVNIKASNGMAEPKQLELSLNKLGDLQLPRFSTTRLRIQEKIPISVLDEIHVKLTFVKNNVELIPPLTKFSVQMFEKLIEIFHVTRFCGPQCNDSALFSSSKFQELESVTCSIDNLSPQTLSQLKSETIVFWEKRRRISRIPLIANFFFQEWLQHKRTLKSFIMFSHNIQNILFNREELLRGLPFSIIQQWEENKPRVKFGIKKPNSDIFDVYTLESLDFICSIDRTDRKLLIFLSGTRRHVIATQYSVLDDVFRIWD